MDVLIIPIVGMAIPIVIVPTALFFKYVLKERELEHAERMRAFELGRALPEDGSWWTPIRFAAFLAFGVPLITFMAASQAATPQADGHEFLAASSVSIIAVCGGCYLASRHFFGRKPESASYAKPEVDRENADFYASHV